MPSASRPRSGHACPTPCVLPLRDGRRHATVWYALSTLNLNLSQSRLTTPLQCHSGGMLSVTQFQSGDGHALHDRGHPQPRAGGPGRRGQDAAGREPCSRSRVRSGRRGRSRAAPRSATSIHRKKRCCIRSMPRSAASSMQGRRVNIIDTPGYPDFLGRTLSALEAVETAVIVVSAVNGVEPMTQRMMDFANATRAVPPDRRSTRSTAAMRAPSEVLERDPRSLRQRLPAAQSAGRRRQGGGRLLLPAARPADGLLLGRGRAHRDHRPGRRGRRRADGALPRAGRGAHARAAARSVRAGAARGSSRAGVLLLRGDRRRRSRSCSRCCCD